MVSFAELKFLASLRTLEPNGAFPQKMLKMFGLTFFEKNYKYYAEHYLI